MKKHNLTKMKCKYCKKVFEFKNWEKFKRKYCSPQCFYASCKITKDTRKEKVCSFCGKKYLPTSYRQKYCSRECLYKARTVHGTVNCKQCGKTFYSHRKTTAFCSCACASVYRKGRTSKGKKKTEKTKRNYLDNLWSELVKVKAGFKCEYCGKIKRLNSHHIYSRSKHSVRWDLDNGVCLCPSCHILSSAFSAHKTPLEFVEWLIDYKSEEELNVLKRKSVSTDKIDKAKKLEELKAIKHTLLREKGL